MKQLKWIPLMLACFMLMGMFAGCTTKPTKDEVQTPPTTQTPPNTTTPPDTTTPPNNTAPPAAEDIPPVGEPGATTPNENNNNNGNVTGNGMASNNANSGENPGSQKVVIPQTSLSNPATKNAAGAEGEEVAVLSGEYKAYEQYEASQVKWGPGVRMNAEGQSEECAGLEQKYAEMNAHFVGPNVGNIYLTFDEGYENGHTPQILDILKEKEVKAVFFITYDYAKSCPELVRRMIDEGHTIGNHSMTHPNFTKLSPEKLKEELMGLHDYVKENFGYEMTLCRPPEGAFSERSLALTKSFGYQSVFWSFAYLDYDVNKQPDHETAINKITKLAHNGAIYLLHAVSKTNTEILGEAIDTLRGMGYTFAPYDL